MTTGTVDACGRLYLPEDVWKRFGRRYRIVGLRDSIKLIPLAEDPVEGLRDALAPIADEDTGTVREQAARDAGSDRGW